MGKVLPGISGSVLAITLNVYEKAIQAINHPFDKNNLKYLLILGIGILMSIILFGNILILIMDKNYYLSMSFFIGLLFGTIPNLSSKVKIEKNFELLILILPILMLLIIKLIKFNLKSSFFTLGIIEAIATIIPGISGTSIYMMMGCYDKILKIYTNPFSFQFIIFILGFILGGIIICYVINLLFNRYHNKMYLFIFSISICSFIYLFFNLRHIKLLGFIIGFLISIFLNKSKLVK